MQTETQPSERHIPVPAHEPHSLVELTEILVRHHGFHSGLYDLLVEFQLGVGNMAGRNEERIPAGLIGLSRVALTKVDKMSPKTVDAAVINPAPKDKSAIAQRGVAVTKTALVKKGVEQNTAKPKRKDAVKKGD